MSILSQVAMDARRVVFDLDSTLLCVSPRSQAILRFLASHPSLVQRHPDHALRLREVEVLPTDWGIRSPILRLIPNPPKDLERTLMELWGRYFFSSEFLHHDVPYPGAVDYVRALHDRGIEIFYLTGRDRPNMENGTLAALATMGLPLVSSGHLIMKPDARRQDAAFKAEAFSRLKASQPVWFFENEPVIIHGVRQRHPEVQIVFMDSVHSGRAEPPKDLPRLSRSFPWPSR